MSMLPCYRLRHTRDPSVLTATPDFESCLHLFRVSAQRNSPASHGVAHPRPIAAVAAPLVEITDPATSERNGSITRDKKRRSPSHEWNTLDEFETWRMKEQLDHGIMLLLVRTFSARSSLWCEKRVYVCSRQGTGGKSKPIGKHLERIGSRPSNRTGCRCRVIIKTYPHTSTVLGWYRAEHDHATGILNLGFTRSHDSTRAYAPGLLRHTKPKELLMHVRSEPGGPERDHRITMTDIDRIMKAIKQEDSVARPISSNQSSYERSQGSPAEVEELLFPEDVGSSQVDEKPEVSNEQSNGWADPGTHMSPALAPISHQVYTRGVTCVTANAGSTPISVDGKTYHHLPAHLAAQAAALPPLIPPRRSGRRYSHQNPVSTPTITSVPFIGSTIHSAPPSTLAVMPASHLTHNLAPPVPPPHDASVPHPHYTPQPLIVNMPHPSYQMTLYPVYPMHYPPPNI